MHLLRARRNSRSSVTSDELTGAPTESTEVLDELTSEESEGASAEPEETPAEDRSADESQKRKPWQGRRLVMLVAGVAVASLLAGIAIMQFIVSPAELAARSEPPKAGLVTAPLEVRVIANTVVTRADVSYAGAVNATIDTGEERAIVTGRVPKVGSVLNAKDVALEVAGRPVIVLPGDLPAYRDLSIGSVGPDVAQLQAALIGLGYALEPTDTFTEATSQAISALYTDLGYQPPSAATGDGESGGSEQTTAERAVQEAASALSAAQAAYDAAGQPKGGSAVVEAQNAVASAQRALDAAVRNKKSEDEIADLQGDVALAQAQLAEAQAPDDVTELAAEVNSAQLALSAAQEDLASITEAAQPGFPASEALFLPNLPRRVDQVNVRRGQLLDSTALVVSGNTLAITGSLSKQDAPQIVKGMQATFSLAGGEEMTATVTKVAKSKPKTETDEEGEEEGSSGEASASPSGPYVVTLRPNKINKAQTEQLRDANVRVKFEIESTEGEVLAVPIAALTAGPDGTSRIEVAKTQNADPEDIEVIEVETGLSAQGFVEIISDDPRLVEGANVVVGR